MPDDILSVGLDTSGFSPEKEATLQRFVALFEKLAQHDGKVFAPVAGGGLVEFNTSVAATSKILDEINVKLALFSANVTSTVSSSKAASSATKQLSFDQIELKNRIDDLNKKRKESLDRIQEQIIKDKLWADNDKKNKLDAVNAQKILTAEIKLYEAELKKAQNEENRASKAQQKKDKADLARAERDLARETRETTKASREQESQMRKEGAVSKILTDDYRLLKQALQDQQVAYTNLYINKGKDDPATKAALAQYTQTAQTINSIDNQLVKAGGSADNFGHKLSKIYNVLLRAAYVIPGLGIAGLFNLAAEYIVKAAEAMGLFSTEIEKVAKSEKELTETLKNQITLFNSMLAIVKQIHEVDRSDIEGLGKRTLEASKAGGLAKDISLPIEKKLLEDQLTKVEADLRFAFGIEKGVKTQLEIEQKVNVTLEKRKAVLSETEKKLTKLNQIEATINDIKEVERKRSIFANETPESFEQRIQGKQFLKKYPEDTRKALRESLEATKSLEEEKIKILTKTAGDYYSTVDKNEEKRMEILKFNADEERKITAEVAKNAIELNITKNERILNAEISGLGKRIEAIRKIAEDEKGLNDVTLKEVLDNTLSTEVEKQIARDKFANANAKIEIKRDIDIAKQIEDNRQRLLTARLAINSNEIQNEAIKNEKIANNEEHGYEERLKSLVIYINKKQTIENLQAARDIDKLPLKAGDEAARTETKRIFSDRDERKLSIQSDVEKKAFDIVESGLRQQLKAVLDANDIQDNENQKAYTLELRRLNDLFDAKEISYGKYARKIKAVQKKFTVQVLDEAIVDDKADIERLDKQLENLLKVKKKYDDEAEGAFVELDYAKSEKQATLAAQRTYDIAVGNQKAVNKAIKELQLKLQLEKDQLAKDELAREIARITKEIKLRNEWVEAISRIAKAVVQAVREISDASYQYRLDQIEKERQLMDEQYGYEIDAIQKSSLYQKDKQALEIQLQAQKMVADKNAQAEEKKLKIEQAQFNKKLAIADATIGIAAAIIKDGISTPKAIADAVIGAITIAKIIATPIPNYEEGTLDHPGGKARIGEKGTEIVKKPYQSPYLVYRETVTELPKGTQVIPIKDHPEFGGSVMNDGWEQTRWLGRQIRKIQPQKVLNKNIVNIDLGFEMYKHKQLYGK